MNGDFPTLILGSDVFLRNHFKMSSSNTVECIYAILEAAVIGGVQAIDVNIESPCLFEAFKRLKKVYPHVAGIGDPNMNPGFMLNGMPLKEYKKEIIRAVYDRYLNERERQRLQSYSCEYRENYFDLSNCDASVVLDNIVKISLDEQKWLSRIRMLSEYCDYCLFGADYADWLAALGRIDLLRFQVDTISSCSMTPISISHWSGLTIPQLETISGVKGHCLLSNRDCLYMSPEETCNLINNTKSVFIGFRALRGLGRYFSVEDAFSFMTKELGLSHFIIGSPVTPDDTVQLFREINDQLEKTYLLERL